MYFNFWTGLLCWWTQSAERLPFRQAHFQFSVYLLFKFLFLFCFCFCSFSCSCSTFCFRSCSPVTYHVLYLLQILLMFLFRFLVLFLLTFHLTFPLSAPISCSCSCFYTFSYSFTLLFHVTPYFSGLIPASVLFLIMKGLSSWCCSCFSFFFYSCSNSLFFSYFWSCSKSCSGSYYCSLEKEAPLFVRLQEKKKFAAFATNIGLNIWMYSTYVVQSRVTLYYCWIFFYLSAVIFDPETPDLIFFISVHIQPGPGEGAYRWF